MGYQGLLLPGGNVITGGSTGTRDVLEVVGVFLLTMLLLAAFYLAVTRSSWSESIFTVAVFFGGLIYFVFIYYPKRAKQQEMTDGAVKESP
jgi:hypothetical protein